jgi:hypothetical protein
VPESQIIPGGFLVSRRDPSALLDPIDESLNQVSIFVDVPIIVSLFFAIRSRRDLSLRTGCLNRPDKFIAVIALIRDHMLGLDSIDQSGPLRDIGDLPTGDDQPHRVAQSIDSDVDLGPETTTRSAQRLIVVYPFFSRLAVPD